MTDREGENYEPLVEQRLGQSGLHVKLDKGFEQGNYCVYVEFDALSTRTGFRSAHRQAMEYCALLKGELSQLSGYSCGETEDASRSGDSRRKRDLETTFLSFPIETNDGRFHDSVLKEQFRVAFLRTGQALDQTQAQAQTLRQHTRQEKFRQQLDRLLHGEAYLAIDAAVKERLVAEVLALAFPPRGIGP